MSKDKIFDWLSFGVNIGTILPTIFIGFLANAFDTIVSSIFLSGTITKLTLVFACTNIWAMTMQKRDTLAKGNGKKFIKFLLMLVWLSVGLTALLDLCTLVCTFVPNLIAERDFFIWTSTINFLLQVGANIFVITKIKLYQ